MTLSCESRANPPVTIAWRRNGEVVDLTEGHFVTTNDGLVARLSVSRLSRELHQGLYSCTASSPVEAERTKSFQVTVTGRYPPITFIIISSCEKSYYYFDL